MCSPEVIGRVTAAAKPTDTSAGPAPQAERPVEGVRRVCFSTVVDLPPLP